MHAHHAQDTISLVSALALVVLGRRIGARQEEYVIVGIVTIFVLVELLSGRGLLPFPSSMALIVMLFIWTRLLFLRRTNEALLSPIRSLFGKK